MVPSHSELLVGLRQRWEKLLPGGISPEPLLAAYAMPARAYHNLQHLWECLTWVDRLPLPQAECEQLSLALFFHDAVYDSRRHDNEQASADWALELLGESCRPWLEWILDTQHRARLPRDPPRSMTSGGLRLPRDPPISRLGQWLVDIDLSILGASPERFAEYQRGIRQEYSWVPWPEYQQGRSAILRGFLDRPTVYGTEFFQQRLEQPARINLRQALQCGGS